MAIKTIEYKVTLGGITPATEQFAGTRGDHRVTKIEFLLTDELYSAATAAASDGKLMYRFDIYDGGGGVWSGKPSPLIENTVSIELEERHTRHGGKVEVYLVITALSEDNRTEIELYNIPARLRLNNRPEGECCEGESYESITTLAELTQKAAQDAAKANKEAREFAAEVEQRLANGEYKGEKGDTGPQGEKGDAGRDAMTDQSYNPESENAQSGKAVAEAVNKCVPKIIVDTPNAPFSSVVAVDNNDFSQGDENGNGFGIPNDTAYKYINIHDIDYAGKHVDSASNYAKMIPARDSNGNLWTGTPIDDEDCVPKKYIDDLDWAVHFLPHTAFKVPSLNVFRKAKVELYLDNCTNLQAFCKLRSAEQTNTTVEHIIFNNAKITGMGMTELFDASYAYRDMTLKHITINFDTSEVTWFSYVFGCMSALEIIDGQPLNLSSVIIAYNPFNYDYALKEVRFVPNTIPISIQFSYCSLLSAESIQNIIDGLKDLTGGTAQVLTLHPTVGNKLTEAQKAIITAKNWTLVY